MLKSAPWLLNPSTLQKKLMLLGLKEFCSVSDTINARFNKYRKYQICFLNNFSYASATFETF